MKFREAFESIELICRSSSCSSLMFKTKPTKLFIYFINIQKDIKNVIIDNDENIIDVSIELAKSIKYLWKPQNLLFRLQRGRDFFPTRKQYWILLFK
jgi:hypothetical protein